MKLDFKVEFSRRLNLGNVGFYDGTRGHILLVGRNIPISINSSPDYKYVTEILLSIQSCPCLERNKSYGSGVLECFRKLEDSGHSSR